MKLEIMQRTMQALAVMDLEAARKVMGIAEAMAEQFPKTETSQEVDESKLLRNGYREEMFLVLNNAYVSVETTVAPLFGARRLPSYMKAVNTVYAS